MERRPFDDVRDALDDRTAEDGDAEVAARPDLGRGLRAGIPEVVHAEHKRPDDTIRALVALADANGRALASRCPSRVAEAIVARLGDAYDVTSHERARAVVVARPGARPTETGGRVGVISAGTSDGPIAGEAALMADEMGCAVVVVQDVGVAGLHRLVRPLEDLVASDVDVIIVAAGMDGALPSVVAGLVAVPVIGLPTSVGYGAGGRGVAALLTMLQSCAPGLVVVNIDNGIGAGATAALIANRAAAARRGALS